MRFRSITPEDYESVREFLTEAGWQHRVSDPETFRKMLENTNRTVVAVDGVSANEGELFVPDDSLTIDD
ncbi:MAG TPA: hypothetical protein VJ023_21800 [Pyrinomonadaceae bacterium]|nr:hypothetical protein [Pyrinomonadaceae bacterium]